MITLNYNEGSSTKEFEKGIDTDMDVSVKHFEKELQKIRTGRAHTSMIEDIRVSAYGSFMPLSSVASLSAPDVQLLVVQPWDLELIADIEKAIALSDLQVNPENDGKVIRIKLPPISSSRRDELAKTVHKKQEEAKVSIRNVRKDVQQLIRDAEKGKKISEDSSKRLNDLLQKATDKFIKVIDTLAQKKEDEIKAL